MASILLAVTGLDPDAWQERLLALALLAANILRQIEGFEQAGLPLEHVIDRGTGY